MFQLLVFGISVIQTLTEATWNDHMGYHVVDLTHTIGPKPLVLPFYPPFNFTPVFKGYNQRYKIWIEDNWVGLPEHTLTHVDAPVHMYQGRPHMHEVPLNKLIGPGVIIDVRKKAKHDAQYGVKVNDLRLWEKKYGRIPRGAVVLMNSGWSVRYPDPYKVFNTNNITDPNTYRYPSWTIEAVEWLLRHRCVIAVGVDTPTVDFLNLPTLPVHRRLFRDSIIAVEGIANLDRIPQSGATIFLAAMKLFNGSGGPTRAFALVSK